MIEKVLEKLSAKCEESYNIWLADQDDKYADGKNEGFIESLNIVQEVAKEYGKDTNVRSNGWIPYTTNGELPNNGQRVWLSFTTPYTSFVKSAWWIYDHFEWENGKTVKDYPLAWKPYEVPAPYQKGE